MAIDKDLDFTGKTILVTGSGRNIGRAIILEFAARGANVIINSRTNEAEARGVEQNPPTRAQDRGGDAAPRRRPRAVDIITTAPLQTFLNTRTAFFLNQQLTASWYLAKAFVRG